MSYHIYDVYYIDISFENIIDSFLIISNTPNNITSLQ